MSKDNKSTYDCMDRALDTGKQMAQLGAASAALPGAVIGAVVASPTGVGIPLGVAAGTVIVGGAAGLVTGVSGATLEYAACKWEEASKSAPGQTPSAAPPPSPRRR